MRQRCKNALASQMSCAIALCKAVSRARWRCAEAALYLPVDGARIFDMSLPTLQLAYSELSDLRPIDIFCKQRTASIATPVAGQACSTA
jgi:hypothetical protein